MSDDVILSAGTKALLESKRHGCFLCEWILRDFEKNGKLTGFPEDFNHSGTFPVEAKVSHVRLEKGE